MFFPRYLVALLAALVLAAGLAQSETDPPAAQAEDPDRITARSEDEAPPALAAVGLTAGFPSYQTIAPAFSVQAGHFGMQAKASWTAAGPYVGLQLRGYPPVPIPVPVFVGAGAGFYGGDLSYHAALGAHVPLGLNLRFDLEGGVANVPLLGGRSWAPHLAAGVSYAFPVDTSAGSGVGSARTARAPACAAPTDPDEEALGAAFERVLNDWIRSARATYGSVYTDLSYGYRVRRSSVRGDTATVEIAYEGSVREIATGTRHSATGDASATFRWTGCAWASTGVSY